MTDNDFNIIPAVENLANVSGLTPTQPREQRKRRPPRPAPQRTEADERAPAEAAENEEPLSGHDDGHAIDYCA